jgi:hypothetical protein
VTYDRVSRLVEPYSLRMTKTGNLLYIFILDPLEV